MDRRTFLIKSGMSAAGFAATGCVPLLGSGPRPFRSTAALHPIEVSFERVIRTTTGLRPHRESGYRLEHERLGDKTVIHNYGHGGAGWSLSWGTAAQAAELAVAHPSRRAAVIGAGAVGLTSARQLQRRGFDVTIYAAQMAPYVTSNMSWAAFTPISGLVTHRTPEWDALFHEAVEIAYREHQLLVGRGYGVSWIYSYAPTDEVQSEPRVGGESEGLGLLPPAASIGSELLHPGEHPFRRRYAYRIPTLRFEPSIYLDALSRDVLTWGGRFVVRQFGTRRDLTLLDEELIVNCTGLGARALFGDEQMIPIKGQLTFLVPQPEVNYSIGAMMPRSDGIALGHVQQRGVWSLEVDDEEVVRAVQSAARWASQLRPDSPATARLRSSAAAVTPPPVEHFFAMAS